MKWFGKLLFGISFINLATIYLNIWPTSIAYFISATIVPLVIMGLLWEMTYGGSRNQ